MFKLRYFIYPIIIFGFYKSGKAQGLENRYCEMALSELNAQHFKIAVDYCDKAILIDGKLSKAYRYKAEAEYYTSPLENAINDLTIAIRLDPKIEYSYYFRGFVYNKINRPQMAIDDLSTAISLNPTRADTWLQRGVAYFSLVKYELALKDFNKLLQLDPINYYGYQNRSRLLVNLNRFKESIDDASQAIAIKPTDGRGYLTRALSFLKAEKYDNAMMDLKMASAMGVHDKYISLYFAIIYDAKKNYKEAELYLATALNYDSSFYEAIVARGKTRSRSGQYTSSNCDFRKAILLNPSDPENHSFCVSNLIDQGTYDLAVEENRKFGIAFPNNMEVFMHQGYVDELSGKYVQAIKNYSTAMRMHKYSHLDVAYSNRADCYLNLKNYKQSIKDCNKCISINNRNYHVYNNRGRTYDSLRNFKLAMENYTQAIKIDSGNIYAHLLRGNLKKRMGENKDAIVDLESAVALADRSFLTNPNEAQNYYFRGLAEESLGRREEALKDFKQAAFLHPKNLEFSMALKRYGFCRQTN